ncbi:hypothetical protein TNCV_805791 [Trichonephila clavipes]|nr:hypothetical protein TNCV_805791 [Trichonephila clavipes]
MEYWFYGHHDHQISHHWIFFPPMSQGIAVSRRGDTQMDLAARLHAACTSVDAALLRCVYSSITRRAQACLDMHCERFKHLLH